MGNGAAKASTGLTQLFEQHESHLEDVRAQLKNSRATIATLKAQLEASQRELKDAKAGAKVPGLKDLHAKCEQSTLSERQQISSLEKSVKAIKESVEYREKTIVPLRAAAQRATEERAVMKQSIADAHQLQQTLKVMLEKSVAAESRMKVALAANEKLQAVSEEQEGQLKELTYKLNKAAAELKTAVTTEHRAEEKCESEGTQDLKFRAVANAQAKSKAAALVLKAHLEQVQVLEAEEEHLKASLAALRDQVAHFTEEQRHELQRSEEERAAAKAAEKAAAKSAAKHAAEEKAAEEKAAALLKAGGPAPTPAADGNGKVGVTRVSMHARSEVSSSELLELKTGLMKAVAGHAVSDTGAKIIKALYNTAAAKHAIGERSLALFKAAFARAAASGLYSADEINHFNELLRLLGLRVAEAKHDAEWREKVVQTNKAITKLVAKLEKLGASEERQERAKEILKKLVLKSTMPLSNEESKAKMVKVLVAQALVKSALAKAIDQLSDASQTAADSATDDGHAADEALQRAAEATDALDSPSHAAAEGHHAHLAAAEAPAHHVPAETLARLGHMAAEAPANLLKMFFPHADLDDDLQAINDVDETAGEDDEASPGRVEESGQQQQEDEPVGAAEAQLPRGVTVEQLETELSKDLEKAADKALPALLKKYSKHVDSAPQAKALDSAVQTKAVPAPKHAAAPAKPKPFSVSKAIAKASIPSVAALKAALAATKALPPPPAPKALPPPPPAPKALPPPPAVDKADDASDLKFGELGAKVADTADAMDATLPDVLSVTGDEYGPLADQLSAAMDALREATEAAHHLEMPDPSLAGRLFAALEGPSAPAAEAEDVRPLPGTPLVPPPDLAALIGKMLHIPSHFINVNGVKAGPAATPAAAPAPAPKPAPAPAPAPAPKAAATPTSIDKLLASLAPKPAAAPAPKPAPAPAPKPVATPTSIDKLLASLAPKPSEAAKAPKAAAPKAAPKPLVVEKALAWTDDVPKAAPAKPAHAHSGGGDDDDVDLRLDADVQYRAYAAAEGPSHAADGDADAMEADDGGDAHAYGAEAAAASAMLREPAAEGAPGDTSFM